MTDSSLAIDRRTFVRSSGGCIGYLLALSSASPVQATGLFTRQRGQVVAREPWGRIERVADGVWALISTPLEDRTTLCNGGIIQGRSGVLIVESFAQSAGAEWLTAQARALTGRSPDHVVLTHYHGDHSAGLGGYDRSDGAPRIHSTAATRDLVHAQDERRGVDSTSAKSRLLASAEILDASVETVLDLGGRTVRIVPRAGHTSSDVTIEIDDPSVVFCGDLVWNMMFPNYVDATPSRLSRDVRALVRERATSYIPGHGPLAGDPELRRYIALLDDVEAAARRAHESGLDAATAAASYAVPDPLGEWFLFNPRYFETAIGAWLKELTSG